MTKQELLAEARAVYPNRKLQVVETIGDIPNWAWTYSISMEESDQLFHCITGGKTIEEALTRFKEFASNESFRKAKRLEQLKAELAELEKCQ